MTTQFQNPHSQVSRRASTTSSATTLVEDFAPPSRSSTASTTNSTLTYTSTHSTSTQHQHQHQHRNRSITPTPTPPTQQQPRRSVENKINRNVTMSPVQAELLRCKGTYTDSGRHSDDWLFGGFSFTKTAKGAWRRVAGAGGNNAAAACASGERGQG